MQELISRLSKGSFGPHCESVEALGALLTGYGLANEGANAVLDALAAEVPGRQEASVFTRAMLTYGDGRQAYRRLLRQLKSSAHLAAPRPGVLMHRFVMDVIQESVEKERTGLLFDRLRVSLAEDLVQGAVVGMTDVDRAAGVSARRRIERFGDFIRNHYEETTPRWGIIVKVYEGDDRAGLRALVKHWEEFSRGEA